MPAQAGRYTWSTPLATDNCDNSPEIEVIIPIEEGIVAKQCDVRIHKKSLKAGLKGEAPIIDDPLWKECDFESSSWELASRQGQRCICITIVKKGQWDRWTHLLQCEEVKPDTAVTQRAFLDISIGDKRAGRIVVGLYGNIVPRTVENFRCLCTGEKGQSKSGKPLHFKGTVFHRIVEDYICQGGDIEHGDGDGGESVFGGRFEDESFAISHNRAGLLSMASAEPNQNGSQFFITLRDTPKLDGQHVVFGEVLEGLDTVIAKMEKMGSQHGQTSKNVVIEDCGLLP